MPNIKSAEKRVKVAAKKALRNKMVKTSLKTLFKKFDGLIQASDAAGAEALYPTVAKKLDQACAKHVVHKNFANNKKSMFAMRINALKVSEATRV